MASRELSPALRNREALRWLDKAERDLNAARKSLGIREYEWACFQTQQAVEKALKALHLKATGRFPPTHDLVFLARKVGLPDELRRHCKELTLLYTYTRYPDMPSVKDIEARTPAYIAHGEEILGWATTQI